VVPDVVIGDMDSIKQDVLQRFTNIGCTISRYPRQKDETDLKLALDYAVDRGAQDICVISALGGRWDMSVATIMLAASSEYCDIRLHFSDDSCRMAVHHPGQQYTFSNMAGKTISFIPLQHDVEGITLSGFEYPLENETIAFGSSRGVSNVISARQATEQHTSGVLLSIIPLKDL